jgi:hypothetical protein
MKKLLITALSVMLLSNVNAQQNSDDDGPMNERMALDGSPQPRNKMFNNTNWNNLTTISLSPFQYTENGVGVGLSYERALDREGYISAYVPVIATFNLRDNSQDMYYYNNQTENRNNVMVYAMPGIKFYPTGMGRVKYAVGPSAVIGVGQKTMYDNYYDPYYGYSQSRYGTYDRVLFGMMINNSLNIYATSRVYIGAEMGFGFTYVDMINNVNRGVTFLTQGSFKIGYTF